LTIDHLSIQACNIFTSSQFSSIWLTIIKPNAHALALNPTSESSLTTAHNSINFEMAPVTLHLRSETKPFEHRSALTPTVIRKLLDKGFEINVERSPERIFDDEEFVSVGATLVEEGSWPNAPKDHIIIGLKELEDKDPFPLKASFKG